MARADRALAIAALPELRSSGSGWSRGPCPYCEAAGHHDRKASFGVAPSGFFSCFRCGVRGFIDDRKRDPFFDEKPTEVERPKMGPPEGFAPIWEDEAWDAECFRSARKYLASRGVTREFAEEVGIGAVASGFYAQRVIIPVLGLAGEWVGWVGRTWRKKAELPYTYPKGVWRAESLYNHSALRVETDEPALVVEGCFDALALWPHGAAVLGKPSAWQVSALAEANRPVAIVMDGDAWRVGQQLALQLLVRGRPAGSIVLPPGVDPDELERKHLMAAARECIGRAEPLEL